MRITILFFFVIFSITAQSQIITTIAGGATYGYSGDGGPATAAELNNPIDVKIDASGNRYICEYQNHCIRKVTPSGTIRTIAGTGTAGSGGDGGPATAALLNFPNGLAIDRFGNIYIADNDNNQIKKKLHVS